MHRVLIAILLTVPVCRAAADEPPGVPGQQILDPLGDAVLRRTDPGADGAVGSPEEHHRPDLISISVGNWQPTAPAVNLYDGAWAEAGGFVRVDIRFDGLINPPGTLGLDGAAFDPFKYGPHPVFGNVEFDIDNSVATGGETWAPGDRYLGNVARFGGKPALPRFADRVALDGFDVLNEFGVAPYVQRSGEEFHIAFLGEDVDSTTVLQGDPDTVFEEGETWLVEGALFHRAHGYEEFSFAWGPPPGAYEPTVRLRWQHRPELECTEVTLVYPLTNEAWIAQSGIPDEVIINGDASDQNSIYEALFDLVVSASYAPGWQRSDPEWPIIADWQFKNPADYLHAESWAVTALVGMSYIQQEAGGALYAWTDVAPGPVFGDINGDGFADELDAQAIAGFIQTCDGNSTIDGDHRNDGRVTLIDFGWNFSVYDLDYNGVVDSQDLYSIVIPGDMDLDLDVDLDDVDDFAAALLYQQGLPGIIEWSQFSARGDFNGDGLLNGEDVAGFVERLISGTGGPTDGPSSGPNAG
jgi:hypothetical protein